MDRKKLYTTGLSQKGDANYLILEILCATLMTEHAIWFYHLVTEAAQPVSQVFGHSSAALAATTPELVSSLIFQLREIYADFAILHSPAILFDAAGLTADCGFGRALILFGERHDAPHALTAASDAASACRL